MILFRFSAHLLTGDLALEYQQNLKGRKITIIQLSANSWRIVRDYVPIISRANSASSPGSFVRVECGK